MIIMNYNYLKWQMSQMPGGQWHRADDQTRYWDTYLRNAGLTWDDVKYPALLGGTSYGGAVSQTFGSVLRVGFSAGYGLGMISKNIKTFYR